MNLEFVRIIMHNTGKYLHGLMASAISERRKKFKYYIAICDRVCKKESSTHIQSTEFKGLHLGIKVR